MSSVCRRARRILELSLAALTCVVPAGARAQGSGSLNANQQLARDIYKELVEINTTTDADPGGTTQAAELVGDDVMILVECMVYANPLRDSFTRPVTGEAAQLVNGMLAVPQGPGLGIEIDEKLAAQHPCKARMPR